MKVHMLMAAAVLLVLLCSVLAPSEALGDWGHNLGRKPGAREDPWPPGDGGDNLPRQGLEGTHSPDSVWKVMGEVHSGSGPPSKAMPKSLLGSGEQGPPGKLWRLPQQPSRSRRPRLSHHLKGYGKFNADTHSCHSIQSRPCQKPSDCGGCLGLYTCKLPTSTCRLKGVSRQRGGFLQTIQSPEGRRILLITGHHSSI